MEEWWEYNLAYRIAASGISDNLEFLWFTASLWFWMPVFVAILSSIHASGLSILGSLKHIITPILALISAGLIAVIIRQKGPCAFEEIRLLSKSLSMICVDGADSGSIPHPGSAFWASLLFQAYFVVKRNHMSVVIFIFLILIALIYLASGLFTLQFFISDALAGIVWGILLTFATRNLLFN
jgi:hypothetical protein